jgi:hypothetical protein
MTRPLAQGARRRVTACHDLPEMSTPDEPIPPRPRAWWLDGGPDDADDCDEREPYPGEEDR